MIEHKTISIAGQVFDNLERDILSGKYERGDVLTEMRLSDELGVSRTPIREALRRLEQEHMIEIGPKGATVIGISEDDIDVIYEMRSRIEGLASRLAVSCHYRYTGCVVPMSYRYTGHLRYCDGRRYSGNHRYIDAGTSQNGCFLGTPSE